jgi:hypothetical protein
MLLRSSKSGRVLAAGDMSLGPFFLFLRNRPNDDDVFPLQAPKGKSCEMVLGSSDRSYTRVSHSSISVVCSLFFR